MDASATQSLTDAMSLEPVWIRAWLGALVSVHLAALCFVLRREAGSWRLRAEPLAILASFFAAALLMDAIYTRVGYTRVLGVAHIVFWSPAYVWVLRRRRGIGKSSLFGKYVRVYLLVAGASLAIDAVDLVRYFTGDSQSILHRWG